MKSSSSNLRSTNFIDTIASISEERKTRTVLALDLDSRSLEPDEIAQNSSEILSSTAKYLCAVKLNYHLLLPLGLAEIKKLNELATSCGLVSIADLKLNDIASTNKITVEYLWRCGFSAVIVNPFVGYEDGLDAVFESARHLGKGVITLAYMSHKGADEGYGLRLEGGMTLSQLFLERANKWGADGVILGSTRPENIRIAKSKLHSSVRIFSPGSGAQGGDALEALKSGADYMIYGRSIVSQNDPEDAARRIYELLLPWTEKP